VKLLTWFLKLLQRPSQDGPPATSPTSSTLSISKSTAAPTNNESKASEWQADPRSERNLATLEPVTAKLAREHLRRLAAEGYTFKITSGTRTFSEQAALYAKGRTTAGPKVTNARAGFSNHNFGTAWDIGLFKGKSYLTDSPIYTEIGQAARSLGLTWGGDFKSFRDTPHYEVPTGLTLAQMRQRVAAGKDIFA